MKRVLRASIATVLTAGAAVALAVSGAQAAATPGWRFAVLYPQGPDLSSVSATGATNAWAVGHDGDLRLFTSHWNGKKWQTIAPPASLASGQNSEAIGASVAAIAGARAMIFVDRENDELGTSEVDAVEWTGTSWSAVYVFPDPPALGPIASGPDDVWSFGSDNGTPWTVHFNGKTWSKGSIPVIASWASASAAAGDWVTGTVAAQPKRVELLHWSKGAWKNAVLPKISVPKGDQMFPSLVAANTPADIWVSVNVGPTAGHGAVTTVLLHWNGKAWSKALVPRGVNVSTLASDGHGGAWVAWTTYKIGNPVLVIYHYSGGRWTHVPSPFKSGFATQLASDLELIPGTRSVLAAADMTPTRGDTFEGAILKYGP